MNIRNWLKGAGALLISIFLFDFLFWQQGGMGANLSIYALSSALLMAGLNIKKKWTHAQRGTLAAVLLTSVAHYYTGTGFATLMLLISMLVYSAFFHEERLKSITSVLPQQFAGLLSIPFKLIHSIPIRHKKIRHSASPAWRWIKLGGVPMIILALYVGIYRSANPKFEQMTAGLFEGLLENLVSLFTELFTPHTLFLLAGGIIGSLLLFRLAPNQMAAFEARFKDIMVRARKKRPQWKGPEPMNLLEKERKTGIVLLILMNALLLIINLIDISWIWVGFEVPEAFDLKQFVHEGTWLLVLSIFLSIMILLYLFRGNLNFHPKRKMLQWLAMAWVAQNFILAFSVFLRNYHYINFHGLAGKRIGVIIFLALVLFGLITMALKIRDKRTGFNLIKLNAWAAFVLLSLTCTIDWDTQIVRANLEHSNPAEIDVDHYLNMAPHTYPLVLSNIDRINEQIKKHSNNSTRWINNQDTIQFKENLDYKITQFLNDYESRGKWAKTSAMSDGYNTLIINGY